MSKLNVMEVAGDGLIIPYETPPEAHWISDLYVVCHQKLGTWGTDEWYLKNIQVWRDTW